jgi:hypothetical protein
MKFVIFTFFLTFAEVLLNRRDAPAIPKNEYTKGISDQQKQEITDIHNDFRNQLALGTTTPKLPFAQNMVQAYWNEEVAAKAQDWANRCNFTHSTREFRKTSGFTVGENIYLSGASGKFADMDFKSAISAWFNEIKNVETANIDKFTQPVSSKGTIGHFTQLAWANSFQIGCGFSQFQQDGAFKNLYVCQYGPVGNVIPNEVYISGTEQKNQCPFGYSAANPKFKGLCCPKDACDLLKYGGPLFEEALPKLSKKKILLPNLLRKKQ